MKLVIDRFEGSFAVCEKQDGTMINIERVKLPKGVKEGQVIIVENNNITIDFQETARRKKEIQEETKDLWS